MKMNIGVIFGGKSGEYRVSRQSASAIVKELDHERYQIWPIAVAKDGTWYAPIAEEDVVSFEAADYQGHEVVLLSKPGGYLQSADGSTLVRLDVAFDIIHGTTGEDGVLQGLFELAELPYVGAGVAGSAVNMDKILMRKIAAYHHIPQVRFVTSTRSQWESAPEALLQKAEDNLGYPMFVKPANAGSSVGVSKASNRAELAAGLDGAALYDRRLLIEEGINAREIEFAVLGNDEPEISAPGEIIASNAFYDYKAKYLDNKSMMVIPAKISPEDAAQMTEWARIAYAATDCAGLARVDFFINRDDGQIYLNEINTLPGFTQASMYAKLWEAHGMPMTALLDRLVELAVERHEEKQRSTTNWL